MVEINFVFFARIFKAELLYRLDKDLHSFSTHIKMASATSAKETGTHVMPCYQWANSNVMTREYSSCVTVMATL